MKYAAICRQHFLQTHLSVWLVGSVFIWLFTCLGDFMHVDDVYTLSDLVVYTLRMMPFHLVRFQGVLLVIATLWFCHRLRQIHYLSVLYTQGVSIYRIVWWLMPVIIPLVLCITLVNEYVSPKMILWAKQTRSEIVSKGQLSQRESSIWVRTQEGFLFASLTDDTWHLRSVYHFVFGKDGLLSWAYAPDIYYKDGKWMADIVQMHDISLEKTKYTHAQHVRVPLTINPNIVDLQPVRSEYMGVLKMYRNLAFAKDLGLDGLSWTMWWQRVLQPLYNIWLIMMTIFCMQHVSFKRSRLFLRSGLSACGVVSVYYLVMEIFRQVPFSVSFYGGLVLVMLPMLYSLLVLRYRVRVRD